MDSAETLWKDNLRRLGEYIRAQRQYHQLSQRDLARLSDLSDTYMSQLERGLHEPSIRVLRALAESLGLRPDQLIMSAAGLPLEESELEHRGRHPARPSLHRRPAPGAAERRAELPRSQRSLSRHRQGAPCIPPPPACSPSRTSPWSSTPRSSRRRPSSRSTATVTTTPCSCSPASRRPTAPRSRCGPCWLVAATRSTAGTSGRTSAPTPTSSRACSSASRPCASSTGPGSASSVGASAASTPASWPAPTRRQSAR